MGYWILTRSCTGVNKLGISWVPVIPIVGFAVVALPAKKLGREIMVN